MEYIWVQQYIHFHPFHTFTQGGAGATHNGLIVKVELHSIVIVGETETQKLQVMEVNPYRVTNEPKVLHWQIMRKYFLCTSRTHFKIICLQNVSV